MRSRSAQKRFCTSPALRSSAPVKAACCVLSSSRKFASISVTRCWKPLCRSATLRRNCISFSASLRSHSRRHSAQWSRMSASSRARSSSTTMRAPTPASARLISLSASIVAATHSTAWRLNSTCSRTCQSSARATVFFTAWTSGVQRRRRGAGSPCRWRPPWLRRASRACTSGIRSASAMPAGRGGLAGGAHAHGRAPPAAWRSVLRF